MIYTKGPDGSTLKDGHTMLHDDVAAELNKLPELFKERDTLRGDLACTKVAARDCMAIMEMVASEDKKAIHQGANTESRAEAVADFCGSHKEAIAKAVATPDLPEMQGELPEMQGTPPEPQDVPAMLDNEPTPNPGKGYKLCDRRMAEEWCAYNLKRGFKTLTTWVKIGPRSRKHEGVDWRYFYRCDENLTEVPEPCTKCYVRQHEGKPCTEDSSCMQFVRRNQNVRYLLRFVQDRVASACKNLIFAPNDPREKSVTVDVTPGVAACIKEYAEYAADPILNEIGDERMTGLEKRQIIDEQFRWNNAVSPNPLFADGYDDCIIGIMERFGQETPIIIYDKEKVIAKIMDDDTSREDAEEFFEFNIIGAWVGEGTPGFVTLCEDM